MSKQTDLVSVSQGSVSGDLSFGDDDKAIFGAGSDLEIYHSGGSSQIRDVGTGNLQVSANAAIEFFKTGTSEVLAKFNADSDVELYYDNAIKLATTATGIDVTGTITADGLSLPSGDIFINDGSPNLRLVDTDTGRYVDVQYGTRVSSFVNTMDTGEDIDVVQPWTQFLFRDDGETRTALKINYNNDISFYEDTGTTPKFFWDASTERLGIGTSSPSYQLDVQGQNAGTDCILRVKTLGTQSYSDAFLYLETAGSGISGIAFGDAADNNVGLINYDHGDDSLYIRTNATERMRIDSSGNVGIGTSSPQSSLHVAGAITNSPTGDGIHMGLNGNYAQMQLNATNHTIDFSTSGTDLAGRIGYLGATNVMQFYTNGSERMRIDSSGNLLVGKTSASIATVGHEINGNGGYASHTRSGNTCLFLNRTTSGGDIAVFRYNGSTVGSIGTDTNDLYVASANSHQAGLWFNGASALGNQDIRPCDGTGAGLDNVIDLGDPSYRFDDIYATNGTIQTSDRNEKQDIEELSDAEQRVAVAAKGLLRKYRWKDAVAEKGDEARIHFGIIAQDLQAAFEAEGLDAGRYGMFISSSWTDEETGKERTRMGVRYPELLAFIIAAL